MSIQCCLAGKIGLGSTCDGRKGEFAVLEDRRVGKDLHPGRLTVTLRQVGSDTSHDCGYLLRDRQSDRGLLADGSLLLPSHLGRIVCNCQLRFVIKMGICNST
jgi:hypothetical protein